MAVAVETAAAAATGVAAVVALWLFIPPTAAAVEAVSNYLKRKHKALYPDGLATPALFDNKGVFRMRGAVRGKVLTEAHLRAMANDKTLVGLGIRILEQKSGDVVLVEPGWFHAVVNIQPCVKLAYDYVVAAELGMIAVVQHLFASKFGGQRNADDYLCVGIKLPAELKNQLHNAGKDT